MYLVVPQSFRCFCFLTAGFVLFSSSVTAAANSELLTKPQRTVNHSLGCQVGIWGTTGLLRKGGDLQWRTVCGWRLQRSLFTLGLDFGALGTQVPFSDGTYQQLGASVQVSLGLRHSFGKMAVAYGIYGTGLLLFQDASHRNLVTALGHYGVYAQLSGKLWKQLFVHIVVDGGLAPVTGEGKGLLVFWTAGVSGRLSWTFL